MLTQFSADAVAGYRTRSGLAPNLVIEVVEETGSTNADLLARLPNLQQPTLLIAQRQTAGKGRGGREWHSVAGASLTFSLAWKFGRPLQELVGLPLAVGVAIAESLLMQTVRVQLKWPNDILRDGKKLGGVLISSAAASDDASQYWCVIGVGLNLTVPDELEQRVGHPVAGVPWLAQKDPNQLVAGLLNYLLAVLHTFEQAGMLAFVARWNMYHAYQGKQVQIVDNGQVLHRGRAMGIDGMGRLLLETDSGTVAVIAGDVSLRTDMG